MMWNRCVKNTCRAYGCKKDMCIDKDDVKLAMKCKENQCNDNMWYDWAR